MLYVADADVDINKVAAAAAAAAADDGDDDDDDDDDGDDLCREHDQAMDVLQGDIDALEREKTELRERVKELSRKTLMEGIVRQSSAGQNCTSSTTSSSLLVNMVLVCHNACYMMIDIWVFMILILFLMCAYMNM